MKYINLNLQEAIVNQASLLGEGKFFNVYKEAKGQYYLIPTCPKAFVSFLQEVI